MLLPPAVQSGQIWRSEEKTFFQHLRFKTFPSDLLNFYSAIIKHFCSLGTTCIIIRVHRSDLMISTCNKVFILQVRRISARSRHDSDLRWDLLYMFYETHNDKYPKTLRSWNTLRQCFNHPSFAFAAFHSTWKTSTFILIKRRLTTWSTSRSKIRKKKYSRNKKVLNLDFLGPPTDSGRGFDNLRRRTGRLARLWGWGHRPT